MLSEARQTYGDSNQRFTRETVVGVLKRIVLQIGFACFALPAFGQADAAKLSTIKLDKGWTIVVTGEIERGDGAKFRSEASKYDDVLVLLESPGGSLADAIDIGETIRLKSYSTAVINGSECNSACALIWLAGSPRALSKSGRIGFHAAYADRSGTAQESGVANAMVGRYLTLLNLPEKAIIFATSSPPSQLSWLTASNYTSTGIDTAVIDDIDLNDDRAASTNQAPPPPPIVTVTAPPTADASADTSVWRKLDSWSVIVDHTLHDGCFLFATFNRGTVFRVGVNRQMGGHYYVMFSNPDWTSLQVGKEYDVQFRFGSNSPWKVPTTAKDMGDNAIFLWATFADSSFWNEFANSDSLSVTRDGKIVTQLNLTNSKVAFDELVKCQTYEDSQARSRDPFAQ
jgi:hypothetical protein